VVAGRLIGGFWVAAWASSDRGNVLPV